MVRQDVMLVIPSLSSGGAERVMVELANRWVKSERINIHFVILTDLTDFYSLPDGVIVHRLGYPVRNMSTFRKVFFIIRTMVRFRFLAKRIKPAFVLSFMTQTNIFCLFSLSGLNLRKIFSERNMPIKINKYFYRFMTKYSSSVILQTKELYTRLVDIGCSNKKLHVIPNPVAELNVDDYDLERENVILSVGRFVEQKGHYDLLKAFCIFLKSYPNYKLMIVGDGPLKKNIKQFSIELNIEKNVSFKEPTSDIDSYYSKAKFFVLSSKREGFPNALLEAFCYGVPCISYDCLTGPSDIISDSIDGYLVPVGNVNLLSEAMIALASNNDLLQKFSRESIKSKYKYSRYFISSTYLSVCLGVNNENS